MERKYDFKKIEEEVLSLWRTHKKDIDLAIKEENIEGKERFTFLEGPPTANAPPALHHVEMRVFKDLFTRFKSLQGFKVSRKGGWDCHGLPVEVQVEKKLGLRSKKEVLDYGVEPFIKECKDDVFRFIGEWTKSTERLAYWVDLDNPYITLSKDYMESVWWALSEIYKKDLMYKGHKIVPYCARCATPLSSHEVAQGYKDVEETTVSVIFPAIDNDFFKAKGLSSEDFPAAFLAWTTTPWTLPSNLALAVNPKVEYAFVKDSEKKFTFILAKDLVSKYFGESAEIIGVLSGLELVGQHYMPLFDYFVDVAKNSFRIIPAEYVTTEDGTGIVHQAPAFGEDDNQVCKENNIDFVNPVDDNGEFTEEVPDYKGRFVKDCDKDIIKYLESKGKLFNTSPYVHSYPFCWRCKTPLIYYAKDTWFIKVSEVRDSLVEMNETVNWYPKTIKEGRFGNWLRGARDWALSRNKFWGTPLPIWICENESCGHQEAIGSISELKEKTNIEVSDLHIMTVDPLTYKCPKCGGLMRRTPEVIDTWFDSGSAPFAQLHYPFENKDLFNELYPYDFIAEAIDQTRGWFYTMMVVNGILFGKSPYKNVAVGGLLTDESGEKMSKSKGNIVSPQETFDTYGVDATRLLMSSYALGNNIKFGENFFKEYSGPFFNTLWNAYFYVNSYLKRTGLTGLEERDSSKLEDEWMLSKIGSTIKKVTEHLESHEYNHALNTIVDFISNTFSKTYIKLIRERSNSVDKDLAFVFRKAFDVSMKLLAPFAPYLTEKIYQDFLKTKEDPWSIHFTKWPSVSYINEDLEKEFSIAQNIIQGLLAAREKARLGVRWPLKEAKVLSDDIKSLNNSIIDLIKSQANIKAIEIVDSFPVKLSFELDYKKLGESFGTETGDVIVATKPKMDFVTKVLNEKDSVKIDRWVLTKDHFKISKIVPEPYVMASFSQGEVYINTDLDESLEAEGFSRELTRRVQDLRKKAGFEKNDSIKLVLELKDLPEKILDFKNELISVCGIEEFELSTDHLAIASEEKVKGRSFKISIERK